MDTRTCNICLIEKPLSALVRDKKRVGGVRSRCKACHNKVGMAWYRRNIEKARAMGRRSKVKYRAEIAQRTKAYRAANPEKMRDLTYRKVHGVDLATVARMEKSQNGRCAICSRIFPSRPHLDHCHATGTIRALLCRACNMALGLFQDSPEILRIAATYIEHYQSIAA